MAAIGYGYGSQWQLLTWLGWRREALSAAVSEKTGVRDIDWLDQGLTAVGSKPSERTGLEFLAGTDPARLAWEKLWPRSGNEQNWDAVAHGTDRHYRPTWLLVEAKAHVAEVVSSCVATGAKDCDESTPPEEVAAPNSFAQITKALGHAQTALGATPPAGWTDRIYQLANRVTILHHLISHGVSAELVLIYFVGDRMDLGGGGRICPADADGWRETLDEQDRLLGLPHGSPWRRHIHHIFLPALAVKVNEGIIKAQYGGTPCRQVPHQTSQVRPSAPTIPVPPSPPPTGP